MGASGIQIGWGGACTGIGRLRGAGYGAFLSAALVVLPASAQDATWLSSPGSADFNTGSNWNPTGTPTGTAFFDTSGTTSLTFSASTSIGGWTFNLGASTYGFAVGSGQTLSFTGGGITIDGGAATITTNNGGTTQFTGSSTGGSAAFVTNSGGVVDFSGATGTVSAGSIAGAGDYNLGSNTLTVGSLGATTEVSGIISGSGGSLTINGGTLTLSGNNTFDSFTTVNNATLRLGHNNALGGSTLLAESSATVDYASGVNNAQGVVVQGDGVKFSVTSGAATQSGSLLEDSTARSIEKTGAGTLTVNSASNSGTTTISAGTWQAGAANAFSNNSAHVVASGATLDINGTNQTVTSLSGAGTVTNNGGAAAQLQVGVTGSSDTATTFSGAIQDGASTLSLRVDGTGPFILSGVNTYTGNTLICDCSILQIGNGGTTGSITSNVTNNNILRFNRSNTYTFGNVISDGLGSPGKVEQNGSGTTIFTNTNTYSGTTTVNAGILWVNGQLTQSATTVNNGGTLGGTGSVQSVTVNSGGTLAPGNSIGTVTVNGTLTFNSGSFYRVEVSSSAADRTNVEGTPGTASLAGTVQAVASGSGHTKGTQYLILHADNGFSGTFSGVTGSGFGGLRPQLVYDSNGLDVYLKLVQGLISPVLAGGTINQNNVAAGMDAALNAGAATNNSFDTLLGLTGGALRSALDQVSGQPGANAAFAGQQAMTSFLNLMLNPFADNRGTSFGPAIGYAPQSRAADRAREAFASFERGERRGAESGERHSVWAAAFGGSGNADADGIVGNARTTARVAAFAMGADYRVSADAVLGFALAGGGTSWGLGQGLGGGRSDMFQVGLYGSKSAGAAYLSAALGYAWHDAETDRTVTVSGTDRLTADFHAHSFGGRLEGGYRLGMSDAGVTPYAAIQWQGFHSPGFRERATSGSAGFALGYDGNTSSNLRTELGSWFDRTLFADGAASLRLRAKLGWAYDTDTDFNIGASFQNLPGSGFVVHGAQRNPSAALASAAAEWQSGSGWSLAAKFDGEFSTVVSFYSGTGSLRYTW